MIVRWLTGQTLFLCRVHTGVTIGVEVATVLAPVRRDIVEATLTNSTSVLVSTRLAEQVRHTAVEAPAIVQIVLIGALLAGSGN